MGRVSFRSTGAGAGAGVDSMRGMQSPRVLLSRTPGNRPLIESQAVSFERIKGFLWQHVKNVDHQILDTLFTARTNFKSVLNLKEMKNIVTHLQESFFPNQKQKAWEALGGAHGVKFRVGAVIITVHNSSATIGHKGHGGCVADFQKFLIRVYEQGRGGMS